MGFLDSAGLARFFDRLKPRLVRGVTQAEYDALPEAEKQAGLYIITDAQGGGGGAGGGLTQEEADGLYLQRSGANEIVDAGWSILSMYSQEGGSAMIELLPDTGRMEVSGPVGNAFVHAQAQGDFGYAGIKIRGDVEGQSAEIDVSGLGLVMSCGGTPLMNLTDPSVGGEGVRISSCIEPETDDMPATKGYVDSAVSDYVDTAIAEVSGTPAGFIGLWSGAASAIPSGWALCNGQNGTPDLRDRFVVGAGSSYAVGAKGGEASHTLTVEEMPRHSHSVSSLSSISSGSLPVGSGGSRLENSSKTTVATGGGAAHNNLPPYYALCYIMKL